jgi:hypothetical protein
MKIPLVGAELFRTDRQTDRYDEVNSRFSQCCEGAQEVKGFEEHSLLSHRSFTAFRTMPNVTASRYSSQTISIAGPKNLLTLLLTVLNSMLDSKRRTRLLVVRRKVDINVPSYFWLVCVCVCWCGGFL